MRLYKEKAKAEKSAKDFKKAMIAAEKANATEIKQNKEAIKNNSMLKELESKNCEAATGFVGEQPCLLIATSCKAEMKTCTNGKGYCTKKDIKDGKKYIKSCK